jgi:hypothetical protein
MKAQGAGKASSTSLVVALGCEATPFRFLFFNPSPKETALIPDVLFVPLQFASIRGGKLYARVGCGQVSPIGDFPRSWVKRQKGETVSGWCRIRLGALVAG